MEGVEDGVVTIMSSPMEGEEQKEACSDIIGSKGNLSQSSSQETVSVKDYSDEERYGPNPPISLSVDSSHSSGSLEESLSQLNDVTINDSISAEWTKRFHSLLEEAPLLEATIISGSASSNGVYLSKVEGDRGHSHSHFNGISREDKGEFGHAKNAKGISCDWLDLELLEEGRRFVRRNLFAVFFAHLIGVAFLLAVRPIQSLLLRTSAIHRKENSLRRYTNLMFYLKGLYESPITLQAKEDVNCNKDNHTTGVESIIPSIHRLERNAAKNFKIYVPPPWEDLRLSMAEQEVFNAVKEDTKQLAGSFITNTKDMPKILFTVNPDVPMSQYDLVIMQYVFFGLIARFPKVFGIHGKYDADGNPEGLQGFIHLWAILGHILGIEEKFNLCKPSNYEPKTNQLILNQVLLWSLKSINECTIRMWQSMTSGSSKYFHFFGTKAMILFMCKDVAELRNCKHLYSVMKPTERFSYYLYKFVTNWMLWISPIRMFLNCLLRLSVGIYQYFFRKSKKCKKTSGKWDICFIDSSNVV